MSREEILNTTNSNILAGNDPDDEELREYAVRQVQILDRVSSRFTIPDAPPNLHYEWHMPTPENHTRLLEKGFKKDDELGAKSNYLNQDGTGTPMIGDVVCYSIDIRKYRILKAIELKAAQQRNDPQKAITDLETNLRNEGIAGLELAESKTIGRKVTQEQLEHILKTEVNDG